MGKDQWLSTEWVSGEVNEDNPSLWRKLSDLIVESVAILMSAVGILTIAAIALFGLYVIVSVTVLLLVRNGP